MKPHELQLREIGGAHEDYDPLLERIGEARFVLIGGASHGTHEFYRERSRITRRLIAEKGFAAVAIEGDWPSAARVNRYVRGAGTDTSAAMALDGFERFPAWIWRNTDVLQFAGWLRRHNDALRESGRAGAAASRTSASMPSRTHAWCATPSCTTAPCSAAMSRPGTCAPATWRKRSNRWRCT
jgi:erythromycin esterase-like protein